MSKYLCYQYGVTLSKLPCSFM